jgi:hypothetical protein
MALGNAMALIRPPQQLEVGDLTRPPLWRSLLYILLGSVAAFWAAASLMG